MAIVPLKKKKRGFVPPFFIHDTNSSMFWVESRGEPTQHKIGIFKISKTFVFKVSIKIPTSNGPTKTQKIKIFKTHSIFVIVPSVKFFAHPNMVCCSLRVPNSCWSLEAATSLAWSSERLRGPYGWWFRNPAMAVTSWGRLVVYRSHYLQGVWWPSQVVGKGIFWTINSINEPKPLNLLLKGCPE